MRRELGRSSLPIILVVAEKESLVDKQIGPYKIVRLIGSGGMGTVYEAVHSQIGERTAMRC